jgi:hypothetical protein
MLMQKARRQQRANIAIIKAKAKLTAKKVTNAFVQSDDGSDKDIVTDFRSIIIVITHLIYTGIPHAPTQDDIYEGYLIPKGSVLLSSSLRNHANAKLI